MESRITLPGGKKSYVHINGFKFETDLSIEKGGEGTAPDPYNMFLASIGSCVGVFVANFCDSHDISKDDITIAQNIDVDPDTNLLNKIDTVIHLPKSFPEKYRKACLKVATQCFVKKSIQGTPEFSMDLVVD